VAICPILLPVAGRVVAKGLGLLGSHWGVLVRRRSDGEALATLVVNQERCGVLHGGSGARLRRLRFAPLKAAAVQTFAIDLTGATLMQADGLMASRISVNLCRPSASASDHEVSIGQQPR